MSKERAKSIKQRKLMGYAYACASGLTKKCPKSIKDIAKSFTKKNKKKGLKSLRDFARTKHEGLPLYKESYVLKFNSFIMNENVDEDVISFLYSLKDPELNGYIRDFLTTDSNRKFEYIDDILIEVEGRVDVDKYIWIQKELKKI